MAKAEWGLKRICASCGTRYYDMKKTPPVCPSCGTVFEAESPVRARRGRVAEKKPVVEASVAAKPEIEVTMGAEEAEEAVIEDAEELGEDAEVAEVVEVEEEA